MKLMKLYSFHKVVRPLLDYLNVHNVPFKFKSSNPYCHALVVPFVWPSSVVGWYEYPTPQFEALVKKFGLSIVKEFNYLLIF